MTQALDAAWKRSVEAVESSRRGELAQAERALFDGWLAAPAGLAFSQREGLRGSSPGSREFDVNASVPLWLPGQRRSGEQASAAELDLVAAAGQAARLRLAGRLRMAAAAARLAEIELRQFERSASALRQLAGDVDRRVRAGDLARADALAAHAELLTAEAQTRAAALALRGQQVAWRLLTGFDQVPDEDFTPVVSDALPESHPELQLAVQTVNRNQLRVALEQARPAAAPELAVGVRHDRPGSGANSQNSVTVGVRVPFGGDAQRQPRIVGALAELEVARAQAERVRERLSAELELAVGELRFGRAQLQAEQERAGLLAERSRLIEKSFRAGESPLPDLLRALGAQAQVELAVARQAAALNLARARVEQAVGNLP